MSRIFISYRRDDSSGHAGRLYDLLSARFGEEHVFMDVRIEPGVDFVETIRGAIATCNVLVAMIGDEWADVRDEHGARRLDDPADFIRLEIETALARPDLMVVPVLVEDAQMPEPDDLPPGLAALARRNAIELSDARWHYDAQRLVAAIEGSFDGPSESPPPRRTASRRPPLRALVAGGLVAVAAIAWFAFGRDGDDGGDRRALVAPSTLPAPPRGWPPTLAVGLVDDPREVGEAPAPELRYRDYDDADLASDAIVRASRAGALPAFAFYELADLARDADVEAGEADGDLTVRGLADRTVMRRWFGRYVAMLRDIGRARAPVVVNLEENLWAFTEATRRPPEQLDVAVRSTDVADLRDPPISARRDDLSEFARVVVALRDELAPDVLLAWNLRDWGSGQVDLTKELSGAEAVKAAARDSARWYEAVGATFDLAFYEARDDSDDVLTHELAAGQLTYLGAFGAATRLRAVLGGIPPSEVGWYLGDDGLPPALNAGVLGMLVSAPERTAADVERYRTAVARYAAAPARLSN